MAFVQISRDSGYTDVLRSYSILLNGQKIGELKNGETKLMPIGEGKHTLIAKIDWCGSESIHFSISPGETVNFSVRSNLRGWRILLTLFVILFSRNSYLSLKQAS
ncbi:MAG: hypothetical protein V4858_21070 [Pseudomonadota bacterium]